MTVLGALARMDVDSSELPELRDIEINDAIDGALLALLIQHRLIGLAARAIETGELNVSNETAEAIVDRHDMDMAATLRIEVMMLRVAELLETESIRLRVLKGSALAHTVATTPSDRSFRDVDVLVRSSDIDQTVAVLEAAGASRLQPELRPVFDRRFAKSVTMRLADVEIDVHRTLAPGPFGLTIFPDDLFLLAGTFAVAGRTLPTLDRTDHLLHACYHAALGSQTPAMTNLRDIALLAAGDVDLDRINDAVERWEGQAVMGRAVELVRESLGDVLPPALCLYTLSSEDRSSLAPYLRDGDRFPALAGASLRALPASSRAAYALAVGLPVGTNPVDRVKVLSRRYKNL